MDPKNLVDRAARWTNYPKYLHFFPFQSRPYRPKAKNLRNWYLDDGLSAAQIAEKLGVSKTFVLDRLHEMGIREICRKVVALVREGQSYRAAARELMKLGFKNRKGAARWEHSTIISVYRAWREKL